MIARMQKSMNEKDKGFTLIELLVVIIIIGILAAIAIPVFLNQRKKAVDASIKSDLRTVANEIETYYTDNQAYPTAFTASTGATTNNTVVIGPAADSTTVRLSSGNVVTLHAGHDRPTTARRTSLKGYNDKGTANDTAQPDDLRLRRWRPALHHRLLIITS